MIDLFYLSSCTSTNDEVLPLVEIHKKSPIGVYTFNQTKGRGQYGNTWESSINENLAITFAFPQKKINISDILFNYCTVIVLRDFIANMTQKEVFIKWPNDIIINEKKVSGILIEKRKIENEQFYIIGIGINVLQSSFPQIKNAGSIFSQTGLSFDLHDFARELSDYLEKHLISTTMQDDIMDKFNHFLYRKNRISVFELKGKRQNGIIQFADENGRLHIDLEEEGLNQFSHKEIQLLY